MRRSTVGIGDVVTWNAGTKDHPGRVLEGKVTKILLIVECGKELWEVAFPKDAEIKVDNA